MERRMTIDDLFLTQRAVNALLQPPPITSVEELTACTKQQLSRRTNCGRMTIAEIEQQLAKYGLTLRRPGMADPPWYEFCL
jgi:DNA-directed RNA polymerase alpha subunit